MFKAWFVGPKQCACLEDYPVKIYSGGTPSTKNKEYWNGNICWLSSGETSNSFIISTDKTITEIGLNNSSARWAKKYDVVIASAGQGHTRGQTSMLLLDTCINQSVIVVDAAKELMPFLYFNIASRYEELRGLSDGTSTRGSLSCKIISKLPMPQFDNNVCEYSDIAWPLINQIESNLQENKRLADIRDTLLPKLMSGELDVSEIDI